MSSLATTEPFLGTPCAKPSARLPSTTKILSSPLHPGLSLVPLNLSHTKSLYQNLSNGPDNDKIWTWIPRGPYTNYADFEALIKSIVPTEETVANDKEIAYAIISSSPVHITNQKISDEMRGGEKGTAIGLIRFLNIQTTHLSVEVGMVIFPRTLQRTIESTLVCYLLIDHAVRELGNERIEWKCNALNVPSSNAAERLGFKFEGIFRRHLVVKGRWRDSWWGSILADEWNGAGEEAGKKGLRGALEEWLGSENFDAMGKQRRRLESFRE